MHRPTSLGYWCVPGIAESVKETEHPCHLFDLCHSHLFCFKRVLRGLIWWPLFNAWFKIVSNSLRSFTEGEDEEMEDHDGAKDHTAENRQEFFRVMARRRMKQKQFLEEIVVGQEVSPRCQRWGGVDFQCGLWFHLISKHWLPAVAGLAAQEFMSPELDLFVSKDGTLDGRREQDHNYVILYRCI